jgi:hypothetical protein
MNFIIENESYALMRAQVNTGMRLFGRCRTGGLVERETKNAGFGRVPETGAFFTLGDVCAVFFSFGNPR